MFKKIFLITVIAAMAITATACCSNESNTNSNTTSNVVSTNGKAESKTESVTELQKAETKEEKAVKENKVKVDKNGDIVDENGKKIEVKDGKVQIRTDSGETITVNTETVKAVNSGSSGGSNNNSSSNPNSSAPKQNNNSYSQPSSKPSSKTWHEAEYEYIKHPAETKKVWVVDKAAYTYEEPVYEEQWRTICNGCGADITGNSTAHLKAHALNDEPGGYHVEPIEVQTGTKTVTVPEQGHYETQVVKEAWTEKKLVKEAGYY